LSRKSVVVELQGGLGNQLFGWAAGYTLSKKLGCELILDKSRLDQRGYQLDSFQFGLDVKTKKKPIYFSKLIEKYSKRDVFQEETFEFDTKFLELETPKVLRGYFQSWKYHQQYAEQIYSLPQNLVHESGQLTYLQSNYNFKELVAVHIRRGDYTKLEDYHGLLNSEYYRNALAKLKILDQAPQNIVVFSDDIEEARKIVPGAVLYVGSKELSSPAENMVLMSRCKALVGANSSFSLWAGMIMGSKNEIRLFPEPWFTKSGLSDRDLLPRDFIRIAKK
jgi:hypothetical protein